MTRALKASAWLSVSQSRLPRWPLAVGLVVVGFAHGHTIAGEQPQQDVARTGAEAASDSARVEAPGDDEWSRPRTFSANFDASMIETNPAPPAEMTPAASNPESFRLPGWGTLTSSPVEDTGEDDQPAADESAGDGSMAPPPPATESVISDAPPQDQGFQPLPIPETRPSQPQGANGPTGSGGGFSPGNAMQPPQVREFNAPTTSAPMAGGNFGDPGTPPPTGGAGFDRGSAPFNSGLAPSNPNELRTGSSSLPQLPVNESTGNLGRSEFGSTGFPTPTNSAPSRAGNSTMPASRMQSGYDTRSGSGSGVPMMSMPANESSATSASAAMLQQQLSRARRRLTEFETTNQTSLPGTPVSLQQMLSQPLSAAQRRQMVDQYWSTSFDWMAWNLARDYATWTKSIPTPTSTGDQLLIQSAQRMAADQLLAAEIQLGKSQSRLADFMPGNTQSGFLPLPSDQPVITSYRTKYETYRSRGALPTRMRGIDQMLTGTLKLIGQRAETADLVMAARNQIQQALTSGRGSAATLIQAAQLSRRAELELLGSVVSYNQAIGDYVLTVEPSHAPSQLVAFMIGSSNQSAIDSSLDMERGAVRQASATQSILTPNDYAQPPAYR